MQNDGNSTRTQMAVSNVSDLLQALRLGAVKPDDEANDGSTLRDWMVSLRAEIDRFLGTDEPRSATATERTADTIQAEAERAILSVNDKAFYTARETQWAGFDLHVEARNDKFDVVLVHADDDPLTPRYVSAIRAALRSDFGEIILDAGHGRYLAD